MSSLWSDEDTEKLRRLVAEGLSASQISNRFCGRYTRCAIMGRIGRLGLKMARSPGEKRDMSKPRYYYRDTPIRVSSAPAPEMVDAPVASDTLPVAAVEHLPGAQAEATPRVVSAPPPSPFVGMDVVEQIRVITSTQCRWPIGAVQEPGFHFCGAEKPFERPYCREHTKKAKSTGSGYGWFR